MLTDGEIYSETVLLRSIEKFLAATGMSEVRFGRAVASDARLVERLRSGKTITLRTAKKVAAYMAHERTRRAEAGARRTTACTLSEAEAEAEDREGALERSPAWRARFRRWFRP